MNVYSTYEDFTSIFNLKNKMGLIGGRGKSAILNSPHRIQKQRSATGEDAVVTSEKNL